MPSALGNAGCMRDYQTCSHMETAPGLENDHVKGKWETPSSVARG